MPERFVIDGKVVIADEASPELQKFLQNLERTTNGARRQTSSLAAGTREATQGFRAMTTGLLQEVNPALGQMASRLDIAALQARKLPPVLGAVTVATAAASIGLSVLVQGMNAAIDRTVRLNQAARALDFSGLRNQAREVSGELERFNLRAGQFLGSLQNVAAGITSLLRSGRGPRDELQQQLNDIAGQMGRLFPHEVSKAAIQATLEQLEASKKLLEVQRQAAAERGDISSVTEKSKELAAVSERIAKSQRDLIQAGATAQKAALAAAFPEGQEPSKIVEGLDRIKGKQIEVAETRRRTERTADEIRQERLASDLEIARLNTIRETVLAGGRFTETLKAQGGELSQIVITYTKDAIPAIEKAIFAEERKRNPLRAQLLELQLQIEAHERLVQKIDLEAQAQQAALEQQKLGVSAAAQATLELALIEERRAAALKTIRDNDPNSAERRSAIEAQARLEHARVVFDEARRTDPATGLTIGLQDAVDEFSSAGRQMEGIARDTARNMSTAFSDLFFNALTGRFREIADLPKAFAQSVLRSLTDALGQQVTARTIAALGGAVSPPFVVSAGGPAGVDVTGADPAMLVNLSQQGYALTAGTGGRTFAAPTGLTLSRQQQQIALLRSVPTVPGDPSLAPTAAQEADYWWLENLAGPTTSAGTSVGLTASLRNWWNTPVYARQGPSGGYIAGPTYGQAAVAGVGAALVAYGLYQGTSQGTNTSYLAGVGTGALTGALYGTSIAPGIGTAVGLVAGALIGFFGSNRSQAKFEKQHRRTQRTRDAATIGQGVAAALAEAETVSIQEVLQRRLVSGNTVGGVLLGLARHMNEPELIGFLLDYGAAAESFSYERLGSIGELVAYLTPQGARALLDTALAMFRREADRERQIFIGQEEVVTRGGTRATVQTLVPLSRRGDLEAGRDTFLLQQPGQSDAELERFLFRLAALDDDRDLRIFRRDEEGLVFSRTVTAR
jgi:hypothetical protein